MHVFSDINARLKRRIASAFGLRCGMGALPLLLLLLSACTGFVNLAVDPRISALKVEGDTNSAATSDEGYFTTEPNVVIVVNAENARSIYVTTDPTCRAGGEWQPYTQRLPYSLPGVGASTVYVQLKSSSGKVSDCIALKVVYDNVPPTLTIDSPADGSFVTGDNVASFGLIGTCSEDNQDIWIEGNASKRTTCLGGAWAANLDFSAQPEGALSIRAYHRDQAGNVTAPVVLNLIKDTQGPTASSIAIAGGAPYTTSASVNLDLASTGASEMMITNNVNCDPAGSWEPYAVNEAGWSLGQLNATSTVYARFRDVAGNMSACVSDTIVHDNVSPSLASASVTNSSPTSNIVFSLSYGSLSEAIAGYCVLENDTTLADCTWTASTSLPANFSVTNTDGAKVLSIWVRDLAGNLSTRVDTNSVTLDTGAPTLASLAVTNASPSGTTSYALSYGANSEASGTYSYCILENSTNLSSCTFVSADLPANFTVSSTNNAKTLSAWIKDAAGNVSTRVDSNAVVLDTTAPTLASATVTNTNPTASASFGLTYGALSESSGTYSYCLLENNTNPLSCVWTAGDLPASYTVTSVDGAKVLSIWVKDTAGNVSTRVDTSSVTLDTGVPTLATFSVTNVSPTRLTNYSLSYTSLSESAGSYSYCLLENDTVVGNCAWTAADLPTSFTVSSTNEAKTLSLWIKDAANNVSTRYDSNIVTLDTVAPPAPAWSAFVPSSPNSSATPLIQGTTSGDSATVSFYDSSLCANEIGSGAVATFSGAGLAVTVAANATTPVYAMTYDAAGNSSSCTSMASYVNDSVAPTLSSATVTNSSPTKVTSYSLSFTGLSESSGTYSYCILENDTTLADCTFTASDLPSSYTVSVTEGAKVLSVWVKDAAGNVSTRTDTNSVILDTTAPTMASIAVTNPDPTNSTTYSLSYGANSESSGTYSYCILENDTTLANCSFSAANLPASFTVSNTNNAKTLSLWIKDAAGNVSTRVDSNSVSLDTVDPTLASIAVTNSDPATTTVYDLSWGALSEGSGTYSYCILENDVNVANCAFNASDLPASFTVSSTNNSKILSAWIKDSAGNVSTRVDSNSVTLDTLAPSLASATITNSNPTASTTYNLSYGAISEAYASYCILENDTNVANCSYNAGALPTSFTVTSVDESKTLSIWLKDSAGNVSTRVDSNSVTLDTTGPTLSSFAITNGSPTRFVSYNLSYGSLNEALSEYCLLENDVTIGDCAWTTSATLPASFTVSSTNEAKVLSLWVKDGLGNISTRYDSNSVTLDTVAPSDPSFVSISPVGPSSDQSPEVKGTASVDTFTLALYDSSSCTNSIGSDTKAVFEGAGVTATVAANAMTVIYGQALDTAGNVSNCVAFVSYTHDSSAPTLASATVTNSDPSSTATYSLSYGALSESSGTYSYCILENDTTFANCSFTSANLPASFVVSSVNEAKVLSIWVKDASGNVSTRVDTNSVTLALANAQPYVTSIGITNSNPTNSTSYNLSWGTVNGAFTEYCILENDTDSSNCSWVVSGTLPSSYTVSSTEGAKVLSVYLKNASSVIGSRRDSSSVTLDTTAPTLASAVIMNSTPTGTTSYGMGYGVNSESSGSYSYCILENDTTLANCSFTSADLPASFTVSGTNNSKILSVWVKDAAGNVSTRVDTNAVSLDTAAPTLASMSITDASPTSSTTFDLVYGILSESAGTYSYCLLENDTTQANCTWNNANVPSTFVVSSTAGAKVLSMWVKDKAGNVSGRVDSNSVTLDTGAPTLASVTVTNSDPTKNTAYSLSYGANSEASGSYSYCILENDTVVGNCAWTAADLPASFTVSGTNEAKVLSVWLKDAAGNVSAKVDSNSVTLDTVAPTLASATVTNSSPTSTTTYSLSYGAITDTYASYCILENDTNVANCSYTAGTLPASYTVSAVNEAKILSIWLQDSAGNVSAKVDSNSVTLDTAAPTLGSFSVTNATPTNSTSYALSYTGFSETSGTYSYCILENDTTLANCSFTSADLPASFTVSASEGAKVLSLWVKDALGNTSARFDSNSVTLDTTAPADPVYASASPASPSSDSSPEIIGTASADTVTVKLYDSSACSNLIGSDTKAVFESTGVTATISANATTTIYAESFDQAGNASACTSMLSYENSSTAPVLASVTVTNSSPTKLSTFSLTYGSVTGSYSSYCILENDTNVGDCTFTNGTLPGSFGVSATNEAKVLSVWIRDAALNVSTRVDANSVTLDTVAPTLASATIGNTSPTATTTYSLSYGALSEASGSYSYCILENDSLVGNCSWTAADLPASFTVSGTNGAKTLSLWVEDAAGNISTRVDTNSVSLDTGAPTLASVTITNSDPTKSTTYNLSYGANSEASGSYSYCLLVNDTTVGNCAWTAADLPSSLVVSSTQEAKVISAWIKDSAGNVSTRVDSNSVTLDTTAPTLASASVTNSSPTSTTTYSLSYGAITDTYASYCILENDTNVANCSYSAGVLPASYTVTSVDESKTLSIWLKDSAGNVSGRVDTNAVVLDSGTPTLASLTVTNSDPTNTTSFALSYGAFSESSGTYSYCILENDTNVANCAYTSADLPASFTVTNTNEAKVLSLWVKDGAGNVSARVGSNSVTLDTVAPADPVFASLSPASPSADPTPEVIGTASADTVTVKLYDSSACSNLIGSDTKAVFESTGVTATVSTNATTTIYAESFDQAGNTSACTSMASYTHDDAAPVLASATVTNSSPTATTTYSLSYGSITNTYSSYCILENDTTLANCSFTNGSLPASFTVSSSDGAKTLSVWIKDDAGNISTRVDTNSVTLDTGVPTLASATVTNTSPTNSTTYNLSYGALSESTGTYSYCVQENSTLVGSCSWTAADLPASYTVTGTNQSKMLSFWIKDSAGNVSSRVDTNSVTLDTVRPTLTIEQASGQSDPTSSAPVNFTVTFSEAISAASFTTADLSQGGTATGITWTILNSGDDTVFTVRATAVTGSGTLVPSVAVNLVQDLAGNLNTASTSSDNSVTYASASPFTADYPFTDFNDYTYDPSKIEFSSGVARLIAADQTDDDNTATGFGTATHSSTAWDSGNSYVKLVPSSQPLPDGSGAAGWTSMTGNVLLMHFNEANGSTTFADTSSLNNNSSGCYSTCPSTSAAKFGNGTNYDSTTTCIAVPQNASLNFSGTANFSFELWYKRATSTATGVIFSVGHSGPSGSEGGFKVGIGTDGATNTQIGFVKFNAFGGNQDVGTVPQDTNWHHLAAVGDTSGMRFYLDGALTATDTSTFAKNAIKAASLGGARAGCQQPYGGGTYDMSNAWNGSIDELAVYNRTLSEAEVMAHYQSTKGSFISRVINGGAASINWNQLAWTTARPMGKELPASTETAYSAGNANMTNLKALWHFNEASGSSFSDSSGLADTMSCSTCPTVGNAGKFNTALSFNGSGQSLLNSNTISAGSVTISAWIYLPSLPGAMKRIAGFSSVVDTAGGTFDKMLYVDATNKLIFLVNDGAAKITSTPSSALSAGKWIHVVGTADGTTARAYVNGTEVGTVAAGSTLTSYAAADFVVGGYNKSGNGGSAKIYDYITAYIDEVAVYSRALSATEVQDLYRRGAMSIKFQARTCADDTCSAAPSFVGPDGTTATYYSELNNSGAGLPSISMAGQSSNQYIQYKAYFDTDSSANIPTLSQVVVGPAHYDSSSPTISNKTGQSYSSLSSFTQTLGAGNAGTVGLQISKDGTNWKYFDGANWVAASTSSQTNTAAQVNSNLASFVSQVGTGTFYFKAFMSSGATADKQVELDDISLGGTN